MGMPIYRPCMANNPAGTKLGAASRPGIANNSAGTKLGAASVNFVNVSSSDVLPRMRCPLNFRCQAVVDGPERCFAPFDNTRRLDDHTLLVRVGNPDGCAARQAPMNPTRDPQDSTGGTTVRLEACIARLGAGDMAARDDLIAFACERMQGMASRMLRRFPKVRRWDETGDVVQNAAIRLYKTLGKITPRDTRGFLGLAAVHIRRELIDLARKHAGPESYAANHETNHQRHDGQEWARVDEAADRADSLDELARWARLHESANRLPDEERELFHLVWYLGTKQEEAARMLGCSVRTVKRRWESVKRLLAESLEGERPD